MRVASLVLWRTIAAMSAVWCLSCSNLTADAKSPSLEAKANLRKNVALLFSLPSGELRSFDDVNSKVLAKFTPGAARATIQTQIAPVDDPGGNLHLTIKQLDHETIVDVLQKYAIEDGKKHAVGATIIFKFDANQQLQRVHYSEFYVQADLK